MRPLDEIAAKARIAYCGGPPPFAWDVLPEWEREKWRAVVRNVLGLAP